MDICICYTEPYNTNYHGETEINIQNKYISIFNPLTLEEFYNLDKEQFILTQNERILTLELVVIYKIQDLALSAIITNRLIILQKKWKQFYYKRLEFIKNPKNILFRELNGRFPRCKLN